LLDQRRERLEHRSISFMTKARLADAPSAEDRATFPYTHLQTDLIFKSMLVGVSPGAPPARSFSVGDCGRARLRFACAPRGPTLPRCRDLSERGGGVDA